MPKNEKKPINFHLICSNLFDQGIITGAVVCRINGDIVYISSNWNVEPSELAQCIKEWQTQGQFITLQGRKYSILRRDIEEYFLGANYKDESFLFGAASPDENDRYYLIGYAPPGTNDTNSLPFVRGAAKLMKEGTPYRRLSGYYLGEKTFKGKEKQRKR